MSELGERLPPAVGAVLAGGAGRRLLDPDGWYARPRARSKPAIQVAGRPLIAYPLAALSEVCERVVVVCKRATVLPPLARVERWNEPDAPRHPVTGIVHALERALGSVLVCAADMPFVTADTCRALVDAAVAGGLVGDERGAGDLVPAGVVAESPSGLEPLLAVYGRPALGRLRAASAGEPLRTAVEALDPVRVSVPGSVVRSVNTPGDLAAAEAQLAAAR